MKVYTKIVIDMDTLETLEEESYEYKGAIAECKSGGAGGGSAGAIAYPTYLQAAHNSWLNHTDTDTILISVTQAMSAAMSGPSPFANFDIVDVDTAFLGQYKTVSAYLSPYERLADLGALDIDTLYDDYMVDDSQVVTDTINAESDLIDSEILSKILPKLHAGMVDCNAVQSSSFVLAEALVWDGKQKMLAKTLAELKRARLTEGPDLAIKRIGVLVEWHRLTSTMAAEFARVYTAARHDVDGFEAEILAKDKLFDLSIFQYGTNVLSSIHGSAVSAPDPGSGKSSFGGAISGALAGGAMGAMMAGASGGAIGGPAGAAAGAALGLAAYYLN